MIKFIRKGGRIIPIQIKKGTQDELTNIKEVQKARQYLKTTKNPDEIAGGFHQYTSQRAKKTGRAIAKRIARFRLKK